VQGEAGLMALNGEANQPPLKFGVAAVDLFTGMYSAQAILAALYQREKTGKGRHVEMALFDCGLMITAYYGLEALLMGEDPPRYGNSHPSIVPYGVFDAADGPLVITVGNNAQFARFCTEVIGRPDLAADERFKTNILRSANRAVLLPELHAELAKRQRADLLEKLTAAGIPCGEVLGLLEALQSKRATDAGLVTTPRETISVQLQPRNPGGCLRDMPQLLEDRFDRRGEVERVRGEDDSCPLDLVASCSRIAGCINEVAVGQAQSGAVGSELVEVVVRRTARLQCLVFGIDDADRTAPVIDGDVRSERNASR